LGATAKVFEGATVVETVLEEVDDFFVRYINYCGALVKDRYGEPERGGVNGSR
jgi:hypothetical protein